MTPLQGRGNIAYSIFRNAIPLIESNCIRFPYFVCKRKQVFKEGNYNFSPQCEQ